jgi:hypothetical protein
VPSCPENDRAGGRLPAIPPFPNSEVPHPFGYINPMSKTLRYSGAIALVASMTVGGVLFVQTLTAAVESPARNAALATSSDSTTIAALERRVAQLEAEVKALETKTRLITSDGTQNFTLNAPRQLSLTGGTTTVAGSSSLSLTSNSGQATLSASGKVTIKASGDVLLKGSTVKINDKVF